MSKLLISWILWLAQMYFFVFFYDHIEGINQYYAVWMMVGWFVINVGWAVGVDLENIINKRNNE